jgi:hypothetical protein
MSKAPMSYCERRATCDCRLEFGAFIRPRVRHAAVQVDDRSEASQISMTSAAGSVPRLFETADQ